MKTNNILYYILLAIAAGILGGVNAQTTPNGALRECTYRGWNTCDRWDHCYWRGIKKSGACFNDCDRILQIGTPRDCIRLRGCRLNNRRNRCYIIPLSRMLQADSKPEATVSGQEIDSSDGFDLKPSNDVRYLLRETNVEKALNREIKQKHKDFHHVDIAGVTNGIEVFCQDEMNNKKIIQLQTALKKLANKRRNKNARHHHDYHLIKLLRCNIWCPDHVCPN